MMVPKYCGKFLEGNTIQQRDNRFSASQLTNDHGSGGRHMMKCLQNITKKSSDKVHRFTSNDCKKEMVQSNCDSFHCIIRVLLGY